MFSVLLGLYLGMEVLGHMVTMFMSLLALAFSDLGGC